MLFNSLPFLIFFFTVLSLYQLPFPWRWKKIFLILVSYYFYAAWNPPFVILLWISTVMDWFLAKGLYAARNTWVRRPMLIMSLAMNLGMLGFFKYGNFILDNFSLIFQALHVPFYRPAFDIILPVGISFYTFQTLSYTLDVYFGRRPPATSFIDYALYIAFFPQLVAGPIVRSEVFLPQCVEPQRPKRSQFHWGLLLMILGLFEKMVIADFLMAPAAERVFKAAAIPGFADAWLGTFAFSIQIFCDFAGYSTCAIGTALCFGFVLPRNFHFPYGAVGFSDFWHRWHVSLSTWLRDYLYIPLGGNRKGKLMTYRNLLLTMLIGGLWHGAAWTFVIWGGLHGLYLCIERFLRNRIGHWAVWSQGWMTIVLGAITFLGVSIAWVFFRSPNLAYAAGMIGSMLSFSGVQPLLLTFAQAKIVLAVTSILIIMHGVFRNTTLKRISARIPRFVRLAALLGMLLLMWCTGGEDRAFIYFQF